MEKRKKNNNNNPREFIDLELKRAVKTRWGTHRGKVGKSRVSEILKYLHQATL